MMLDTERTLPKTLPTAVWMPVDLREEPKIYRGSPLDILQGLVGADDSDFDVYDAFTQVISSLRNDRNIEISFEQDVQGYPDDVLARICIFALLESKVLQEMPLA